MQKLIKMTRHVSILIVATIIFAFVLSSNSCANHLRWKIFFEKKVENIVEKKLKEIENRKECKK